MSALTVTYRRLVAFARSIGKDTRGEDLTEKSSGLSNAGKVAIAAVVIAAAGAGATTLTNAGNKASDTTSGAINGTVGTKGAATDQAKAPFAVPQ